MRVDNNFEQILFEANESFLMLAPETRIGEKLSSFPPPSLSLSLSSFAFTHSSFFLFLLSLFSSFLLLSQVLGMERRALHIIGKCCAT